MLIIPITKNTVSVIIAVVEEAHGEREALRQELVALRGEMEKLLARLDEKQP